jgi:hypothetical protein
MMFIEASLRDPPSPIAGVDLVWRTQSHFYHFSRNQETVRFQYIKFHVRVLAEYDALQKVTFSTAVQQCQSAAKRVTRSSRIFARCHRPRTIVAFTISPRRTLSRFSKRCESSCGAEPTFRRRRD